MGGDTLDYQKYVEFCHENGYSVLPYYMKEWRKYYLTKRADDGIITHKEVGKCFI